MSGEDQLWNLHQQYVVPSAWCWSEIEQLTTAIIGGCSTKKSDYTNDGVLVLNKGNIRPNGRIVFDSTRRYVSHEYVESYKDRIIQSSDLVVTLRDLSQKADFLGLIGMYRENEPALLTQGAYIVRLAEPISPKFIMHYSNSPHYRILVKTTKHGTTQLHLRNGDFLGFPTPVPPYSEQHRIVEAIESYLTRLDDAVASLERVQRNLKRYRASVLKSAVEGRLVPTEAELAREEGRDYEPASVLLERILQARRERWIADAAETGRAKAEAKATQAGKPWTPDDDAKALETERTKAPKKYKEPTSPNTDELPDLPEGWCWASVEQIGHIASGQTPRGVTTAGTPEGDIPWFRVGDMNTVGNETHMRIASEWLSHSQVKSFGLHVRPAGTITFPKRGGAIKTNKKRLLAIPSTYDLNTMGIVPVGSVGPYLWMWFSGIDLGALSDGSNVPQLNHDDIAPLPIPLPPAAEQQSIVDELGKLLSVAEENSQAVAANSRRCQRLRQSILKWAFEGKLVDQDPNDEPASVLLERIKDERAAMEQEAKKNGRKRKAK